MILLLIVIYLLGVIFGIINESIAYNFNEPCLSNPSFKCFAVSFFFNIYGWGLVLLTLFLKFYYSIIKPSNPLFFIILPIIIFFLIALFECLAGQISLRFHGKQTWNYHSGICNGYIAFIPTFYFTLVLFIYSIFIYPFLVRIFE